MATLRRFVGATCPAALSQRDPYVVWDPSRVGGIDLPVAYGREEVSQAIRHYIGAFKEYDFRRGGLPTSGPARYSPCWPRKDEVRAAAFLCGSPSPRSTP